LDDLSAEAEDDDDESFVPSAQPAPASDAARMTTPSATHLKTFNFNLHVFSARAPIGW
jgi:hypothetical protein